MGDATASLSANDRGLWHHYKALAHVSKRTQIALSPVKKKSTLGKAGAFESF